MIPSLYVRHTCKHIVGDGTDHLGVHVFYSAGIVGKIDSDVSYLQQWNNVAKKQQCLLENLMLVSCILL